tara:strand:+ start:2269 stop:3666 length:1398 start_codon:yes stop_codon:yes gene_type:complete
MAYQPIVLGSNITGGDYGALPTEMNYYVPPAEIPREQGVQNADGSTTMPTYGIEAADSTGIDWSMYGTEYLPMFNYFTRVKTGEYKYNPDDDKIDPEDPIVVASLSDKFEDEFGMTPQEAIKQELVSYGQQVTAGLGAQYGRSVAAGGEFTQGFEGMDLLRAPKTGPRAKVPFSEGTKLANLNSLDGQPIVQQELSNFYDGSPEAFDARIANLNQKIINQNAIAKKPANTPLEEAEKQNALKESAAATEASKTLTGLKTATGKSGGIEGYLSGVGDRSGFGKDPQGNMSAAGRANIFGAAGAGGATVAYNLIQGNNLKESAKAGAKVGLGTYLGGLVGGSFGSMIGGMLGGRVICNELMRQGVMTRKQVVLDYKFTRDYLTPTHVNGYHVWAVWMVKQMRQGRLVNFWKHVAGHRANEIAYIYGERDKPDYLGKVYRKILEPICWSIGFFCKKTDWAVLYTQKEI